MDIKSLIDDGESIKSRINVILSTKEFSYSNRSNIIASYYDMIIEHHSSIHLLIQKNFHGSAFALVRIFYELIYKIHWANKVATDEDIDNLINGKNIFPTMNVIVADIDNAFELGIYWQSIHKHSWKAMNDYTHTGILQVSRRFSNNHISPDYSKEEIIEVINNTNLTYLIVTIMIFEYFDWKSEAPEIDILYNSYLKNNCIPSVLTSPNSG